MVAINHQRKIRKHEYDKVSTARAAPFQLSLSVNLIFIALFFPMIFIVLALVGSIKIF